MKYLVTFICILLCSPVIAQSKDGIYKSDASSFRQNFFLVKKGNSLTLYGWEQEMNGDTIYYRSAATLSKKNYLTFEKFDFSKSPVTEKTINQFQPDKTIHFETFLLHRHFGDIQFSKKYISAGALKDPYDGRVDGFRFSYIQSQ